MKQFTAHVVSNHAVSRDFHEMVFQWEQGAGVPQPGQFFTVRVAEGISPLLRRPFAFSAFDERGGMAAMIYQRRGRGTELLAALAKGDPLDLIGPLGSSFPLPPDGSRAVLVGGGIGLGPVLFLARTLRQAGIEAEMVFGCRTKALVPELRSFAAAAPRICTDDGSAGFKGTTADYLESIEQEFGLGTMLYACGPEPMLRSCNTIAARTGATCYVSVEQVMACGVGACMGCVVKVKREPGFARACTEGPVFKSDEIDWEGN